MTRKEQSRIPDGVQRLQGMKAFIRLAGSGTENLWLAWRLEPELSRWATVVARTDGTWRPAHIYSFPVLTGEASILQSLTPPN